MLVINECLSWWWSTPYLASHLSSGWQDLWLKTGCFFYWKLSAFCVFFGRHFHQQVNIWCLNLMFKGGLISILALLPAGLTQVHWTSLPRHATLSLPRWFACPRPRRCPWPWSVPRTWHEAMTDSAMTHQLTHRKAKLTGPRVDPRHMRGHYEALGNAIRPRTVGPSNQLWRHPPAWHLHNLLKKISSYGINIHMNA